MHIQLILNVIKVIFKEITKNTLLQNNYEFILNDYIPEIPEILIKDTLYEFDERKTKENILYRISDTRIAIIIKNLVNIYDYPYYTSILIIVMFNIYGFPSKAVQDIII